MEDQRQRIRCVSNENGYQMHSIYAGVSSLFTHKAEYFLIDFTKPNHKNSVVLLRPLKRNLHKGKL